MTRAMIITVALALSVVPLAACQPAFKSGVALIRIPVSLEVTKRGFRARHRGGYLALPLTR